MASIPLLFLYLRLSLIQRVLRLSLSLYFFTDVQRKLADAKRADFKMHDDEMEISTQFESLIGFDGET